jgi:hypothetical protein
MKRALAPVLIAAALFLLTACSRGSLPTPARRSDPTPRVATSSELTEAEKKWGVAPGRGKGVTYQPDVVLLDAGPDAIRGMNSNGLEWSIDPAAAGASQIQAGKILFATHRAAGRVLGVRKEGNDLKVVLGPILLTDVYRDLSVKLSQPVDFGDFLPYSAPDLPGSSSIVEPREMAWSPDESASVIRTRLLQVVAPRRFKVTPLVNPRGLGMRIASDEQGLKVVGQAYLYLTRPTLNVNIWISGGTLRVCELELTGAAGVLLSFDAASAVGVNGNISYTEPGLPTDFSLPIFMNESSPFAINVRQAFIVNTAFGGKGSLTATGNYLLEGSFRIGFRDGSLSVGKPTRFSERSNPADSIQGVSLGTTGLVLTHSVKVIVGVGAFGFATGPFVRLNSAIGISRDSDLMKIRDCHASTFRSSLGVGIGYVMPKLVTSAINFFLRALNIEEITGEGGIETAPAVLVDSYTVRPKLKACGAG